MDKWGPLSIHLKLPPIQHTTSLHTQTAPQTPSHLTLTPTSPPNTPPAYTYTPPHPQPTATCLYPPTHTHTHPKQLRREHHHLLRTYRHVRYMWLPYTDAVVVVVSNPFEEGATPLPA
jgi:hypothetical protein